MTSAAVRQAAAVPDMSHRDFHFQELMSEVKTRLLTVYPGFQGWTPYLLGGSGTAAVEALVTSCVNSGPVLVIENGYYSARISQILDIHAIPHEVLRFGWLDPIDLLTLEQKLSNTSFEAVLVTHNETTTGRLNPVDEIGRIARRRGARCYVDAMSSFGADELRADNLDAVVSSANKCLHGVPGVSFALLRPDLTTAIRSYRRRTYYLHLPLHEGERPSITPPVPALSALRQALRELGEGGATRRRAAYLERRAEIRTGLTQLGLKLAVPELECSCTMTVASVPAGFTWTEWFNANRAKGYVLYECKGELQERFFQAANMGEISMDQIRGWLDVAANLMRVKAEGGR